MNLADSSGSRNSVHWHARLIPIWMGCGVHLATSISNIMHDDIVSGPVSTLLVSCVGIALVTAYRTPDAVFKYVFVVTTNVLIMYCAHFVLYLFSCGLPILTISMARSNIAVSSLLADWRYSNLALSHRYHSGFLDTGQPCHRPSSIYVTLKYIGFTRGPRGWITKNSPVVVFSGKRKLFLFYCTRELCGIWMNRAV